MPDHVYKNIDVTGSSKTSSDDAVRRAISKAGESIRGMRWEFLLEDTDAGTNTIYGDGSGDCHPVHGETLRQKVRYFSRLGFLRLADARYLASRPPRAPMDR